MCQTYSFLFDPLCTHRASYVKRYSVSTHLRKDHVYVGVYEQQVACKCILSSNARIYYFPELLVIQVAILTISVLPNGRICYKYITSSLKLHVDSLKLDLNHIY